MATPTTRVLIADIGATNARFRVSDGGVWEGDTCVLPTGDYADSAVLLEEIIDVLRPPFSAAVLAVAGPIDDRGGAVLTNTGMPVEPGRCERVLGCPVQVVNDFHAVAAGLPDLQQLHQVGGGVPGTATKAVLGPGSGLGMATLVPLSTGGWQVLAGEGGHADMAPGSHLETELWQVLMSQHGHVSWERVLSGPGLVNLHAALSVVWGNAPAEPLAPADILSAGVTLEDPICHQTLETFCGLLGAAAGNLAVTVGARGGVYIAGGIVPRMIDFVSASPLRRRFEERGPMHDYVADIPLLLITGDDAGLVGARACTTTR